MATTRRMLQLDDLDEGSVVEFRRMYGIVSVGIYRGLCRWKESGVWLVRLEDAAGGIYGFHARSVRSMRILRHADQ